MGGSTDPLGNGVYMSGTFNVPSALEGEVCRGFKWPLLGRIAAREVLGITANGGPN